MSYPKNNDDYSLQILNKNDYSDSDSTSDDYIIHSFYRKSKKISLDQWEFIFSDDIWYMWSILKEYTRHGNLPILDSMDYPSFVSMCYHNSNKDVPNMCYKK